MFKNWGHLLIALFIGVVLAIMAITPPSSKGKDTAADQFSSARAMKDVRIIAAEPHPTGTPENAKVREYLKTRLAELGLEVNTSTSMLGERSLGRLNRWKNEDKTEQEIVNIIGVLPGSDSSKPALLLMAHHDTVWGSPGAADATIGVAGILEIVSALQESGPQERDLIVLLTDAEEPGLAGARDFFANHPLRDSIGAVINFEARGGGGTANMFQTSAKNGNAAKLYARSVREPSVSSLSTFVYSVLPNDTDLTPALEKDYVAYNIANIGLAQYYHSPKIDADALDERTLQHMGSQGLDLARALLSANDMPAKKPDATFFDLFGFFTIIFAPFWGWVFIGLAVLCAVLSLDRKAPRREIFTGLLRMLIFLGLGGVFLHGLNIVSGNGPSANYYDRLAAIPKLEGLAFLLCFAAFFTLFAQRRFTANRRFGALLPIFAIGIVGQIYAPTAAYFITLPVLMFAIASMALERWPDKKFATWLAVIFAALIIGYMIFLGHLLMLGVGPDMLAVAILPAAIAVLAIILLKHSLAKRPTQYIALASFALAVGMAFWIRLDPIAATVPIY